MQQQAKQMEEMAKSFDMAAYQKDRIRELEAQKAAMGSGMVDQNLDAEQVCLHVDHACADAHPWRHGHGYVHGHPWTCAWTSVEALEHRRGA